MENPQANNWLYDLIFQKVAKDWRTGGLSRRKKTWQYVLVEEYVTDANPTRPFRPIRAWIHDQNGLHEITLDDHAMRKRDVIDQALYPFLLFSFRVDPERGLVIMRESSDRGAGVGREFQVQGTGKDAVLKASANWYF